MEDVLSRRESDMAAHAYSRNREDLISFYKKLASRDPRQIPPKTRAEDSASKALEETEALLRKRLSGQGNKTARFSLALFLLDRAKTLHGIVMNQGNLSMYSLFVSLRNAVCLMLGPPYYLKTDRQIMDEYLDIEPLLTACSELCGLQVPRLEEIMKSY